uniref:Phosphatidic acid phosphatase type 2/haloperoxidase domain-containing protein n=1 Tax=viral metagenome TaxID=1070528 RepID=A0A6C0D7S3_9ZZZZ
MPVNLDYFKEFILLFPDSILFGSVLLGLSTLSLQHGLFFMSFLESFIALSGLQNILSFVVGNSSNGTRCKSKFHTLMFGDILGSTSADTPSYGIYVVSFACAYMLTSLYEIKDELDVLDSSFYKQYNTSFYVLTAIPILYAIARVVLHCDSVSSALVSLFVGAFIGILLEFQNVSLFGRNATNFLGIPLLRNKTVNNEPIYICSK